MKVILPEPPEGYEQEAEFRPVRDGELYMDVETRTVGVWLGDECSMSRYFVLKPKPPVRWRAEPGGEYWTLEGVVHIVPVMKIESGSPYCNARYEFGLYFRTKEQAEELSNRLRATVDAFHAEREEGR